jgi:hypothetical protein
MIKLRPGLQVSFVLGTGLSTNDICIKSDFLSCSFPFRVLINRAISSDNLQIRSGDKLLKKMVNQSSTRKKFKPYQKFDEQN